MIGERRIGGEEAVVVAVGEDEARARRQKRHVRAIPPRGYESHQTFCERTAHRFFDVRRGSDGLARVGVRNVWAPRLCYSVQAALAWARL